jgi:hypothetical protein
MTPISKAALKPSTVFFILVFETMVAAQHRHLTSIDSIVGMSPRQQAARQANPPSNERV